MPVTSPVATITPAFFSHTRHIRLRRAERDVTARDEQQQADDGRQDDERFSKPSPSFVEFGRKSPWFCSELSTDAEHTLEKESPVCLLVCPT